MTAKTQLALVAAFRAGDQDAFTSLFNAMTPLLRRSLGRIVPDSDLDDVIQETMLKVYTHIDTFKGESQFTTWCTRIGINAACTRRRGYMAERKHVAGSLDDMYACGDGDEASRFPEPGYVDTRHEERVLFDRIVAITETALTEDQKAVLLLRADGLSMQEIAAITAKKVPSVKSILSRGRARLRGGMES